MKHLILACLLVSGASLSWIGHVLTRPLPSITEAAPVMAPATPVARPIPPSKPLSSDSGAALTTRPPFLKSRRPPAPRTEATPAASIPSPPPTYQLVGTALGERRLALLRAAGQGPLVRVHEGEALEGWRVEAITPTSLVLEQAGTRHRLELVPEQSQRPPFAAAPFAP